MSEPEPETGGAAPEASRGGRRGLLIAVAIAGACGLCCVGSLAVGAGRGALQDLLAPAAWELSFRLEMPDGAEPTPEDLERARQVLGTRLAGLAVPPRVAVEPPRHLTIGLPEMPADERADVRTILTTSGRLDFKIVVTPESPSHRLPREEIERLIEEITRGKEQGTYAAAAAPYDVGVYRETEQDPTTGERVVVSERPLLLSNEAAVAPEIADAYRTVDSYGSAAVSFELTASSAAAFRRLTADNIREQLAIVLDGTVRSYPVIRSEIGSRGIIELGAPPPDPALREEEVRQLIVILKAGGLPGKLVFESEAAIGR